MARYGNKKGKAMKETVGLIVIWCCVVVGVLFGAYYATAYFAPKYEAVRRDVMINSRYYDEATTRELYRLKRQYESASTDEAKQTIAAAARHEFGIYDSNRLPGDLYTWMEQIR